MNTMNAHVTSDAAINEATVGVPCVLVTKESLKAGKPVEIGAGGKKTLTFKCPVDFDFVIEWISLAIYQLAGSAGSRTATRINPDASIGSGTASDLRFSWYDGSTARQAFTDVPWSMLAGNGFRPLDLGIPHLFQAGRVINISVTNNDASNAYAIALQLHGRRRALQGAIDRYRERLVKRRNRLAPREFCQLVPDNNENARGAGLFRTIGVHAKTISSGNFDVPGTQSDNYVRSEEGRNFFVNKLFGRQRVSGTVGWVDRNTHPVLVRIYNADANEWFTEGWVPMECLFGWGGEPGQMPVEWVWRAKAKCDVSFKSMHSANVICDVTFGGYVREEGYL